MNTLQLAHLSYGSGILPIQPSESLPLPAVFNFDQPEECARKIFAVMSNASGGFTLRGCTLKVDPVRKTANLTANGCHVYYADPATPKLGANGADLEAELLALIDRTIVTKLGDVATDQYGNGHERARWVQP